MRILRIGSEAEPCCALGAARALSAVLCTPGQRSPRCARWHCSPALSALRALALLCIQGSRAKICDIVKVNGVAYCAPALFVPAFGKCGTNSIRAYTLNHPHIKWPVKSEPHFDPLDVSPAELVRQHNPGVKPNDPYVWAVKCPSERSKDPRRLAADLKRAYPSAVVLLTMCDPELLPFRWYRHYVSRTLAWRSSGVKASSKDLLTHVVFVFRPLTPFLPYVAPHFSHISPFIASLTCRGSMACMT